MKRKGYVFYSKKKSTDVIIKVFNKLHLIELKGYRAIYNRFGDTLYYALEIYGYKLIVKALVRLAGNRSLSNFMSSISDNPDKEYNIDLSYML